MAAPLQRPSRTSSTPPLSHQSNGSTADFPTPNTNGLDVPRELMHERANLQRLMHSKENDDGSQTGIQDTVLDLVRQQAVVDYLERQSQQGSDTMIRPHSRMRSSSSHHLPSPRAESRASSNTFVTQTSLARSIPLSSRHCNCQSDTRPLYKRRRWNARLRQMSVEERLRLPRARHLIIPSMSCKLYPNAAASGRRLVVAARVQHIHQSATLPTLAARGRLPVVAVKVPRIHPLATLLTPPHPLRARRRLCTSTTCHWLITSWQP